MLARGLFSLRLVPQLTFLYLVAIATNENYGVFASSAAGTQTLIAVVGKDYVMLGADSSVSQSIVLTSSNIDKMKVIADPFPGDNHRKRKDREQQTIAVAAAGDFADADRLVSILRAHAALNEFEASIGCDVDIKDLEDDDNNSGKKCLSRPGLSVRSVAKLARGQIAQNLRSGSPFQLGVLIAGMQNEGKSIMMESKDILLSESPLSYISEEVQRQVQQVSPTDNHQSPDTLNKDLASKEKTTTEVTSTLRPHLYWLDEYGSLQKLNYASHGLGSNFLLAVLDQGYRDNLSKEEAVELIKSCFQQLRVRYLINSEKPPIIKCVDAYGCRIIH